MSKRIVPAALVAALFIAVVAQAQTTGDAGKPQDKTATPPPAPAAAAPAAPVAAPKPVTVVLKGIFEGNSAGLTAAGKIQIDQEVVTKIKNFGQVKQLIISGHTDRVGRAAAKQRISEKRANAVKDYLVSKGVDGKLIDTFGFGATQPVQGVARCEDKLPKKKLIECLAPHNRVEVEIQPAAK